MSLIAVTSQNARTLTAHAGRCRRFFLFDEQDGTPQGSVELSREEVLHETDPRPGHPLEPVRVLISAGMRQGLQRRLQAAGIQVYLSEETSPVEAVRQYLSGLPSQSASGTDDDCGCGCDESSEEN